MKDVLISLGSIAAGAYILTIDMRLWPISATFVGFGVLAWLIFKAQDKAHERAIVSKDPTEARGIYGGGLLVVILFLVVVFMMLAKFVG